MLKLLDLTLNGLNTGMVYGLIAIGYTMVYGIVKLINFAHGEVCMLGAMISFALLAQLMDPGAAYVSTALFFLVLVLAGGIDAGVGLGLDAIAYRPLRRSSRLSALITAIAMSLLLQNLAAIVWGPGAKALRAPEWFFRPVLRLGAEGQVAILAFQVLVLLTTLLCMSGLYLLVMKTRLGMAMRACAQNPTAAAMMGIRLDRVVALTFCIGSFLGAIGGVTVALNKGSFDYQVGLYVGVVAFAAAVLGGIGSIPGAMLGGLIIGVVEALAAGYLDRVPHPFRPGGLHIGYKEAVGFLALIAIILLRPQGLLGSQGGDRA